MKTVISVSQGSSEYDYDLETEFLGHSFRVIRAGTDGDLARAVALLKTYHERADAFGLSMVSDHYQVGSVKLEHPDTLHLG